MKFSTTLLYFLAILFLMNPLVVGCGSSVKPDADPDGDVTSTDGTVDVDLDRGDTASDSSSDGPEVDLADLDTDVGDTPDLEDDSADSAEDLGEADRSDGGDDVGEGDGGSDLDADLGTDGNEDAEVVEVCDPENQFDNWNVREDRTLTKACSPYMIDQRLDVGNGATLTIEAGVALHFDFDTWLRVGGGSGGNGRLIADGTEEQPIVFTTQDDHREAGQWYGLVFGPGALSVSVEHAQVLYGGRSSFGVKGCLTIDDAPSSAISLDKVTFENCLQSGLAHLGGDGQDLAGLRFVSTGDYGLHATPTTLGDVGEVYEYDDVETNFLKTGTVAESATWLAQGIPFETDGRIDVQGDAAPVLTLGEGLELLFPDHAWLRIGASSTGSLRVEGTEESPVRLASAISDEPGGWHGVHFQENTFEGSSFDWVIIEHAGRTGFNTRGCVTINGTTDGAVSISNSVFRDCALSGVGVVNHDFGFYDFVSNTFEESDAGLWLPPHAVASVGSGHSYGGEVTHNLMDGGDVEEEVEWYSQGIPWHVDGTLNVAHVDGADLWIRPGVHLQFANNSRLRVGGAESGQFYAVGTFDDPIIIEGQASASAGSWHGVHFDTNTLSDSRLEHVTLRHGGKPGFNTAGCVTVRAPAGRVSIIDSSFDSCEQACIGARGENPQRIEDNSLSSCPLGMWLHADAVGSVSDKQSYDGVTRNRIDGGTVSSSAAWVDQSVPYDVEGDIVVEGDPTVTLDIAAGVELRFESSGWLSVGGGAGAILNIDGTSDRPVVMTSSLVEPTAGAWHGIFLRSETESAAISYLDLSFAGQSGSNVRAALTLSSTGDRVEVLNSQFSDNAQVDVYIDCGSSPTLTANTYLSGGTRSEACR